MSRGKLILIEGLDRTGKTTQSTILLDRLKPNAALIKFPDRTTPIGNLINRYLVDKEFKLPDQAAHLLFSANRWEVAETIKDLLLQGKHVILDRYVYSGIAYSAAKGIKNMDLNWCLQPDKGLLKPDLTLFLTNDDPTENEIREGFGEERYEVGEFQQKVKEQFFHVFQQVEGLSSDSSRLKIVNVTNQSIEKVAQDIWELVRAIVSTETEPCNRLLYF